MPEIENLQKIVKGAIIVFIGLFLGRLFGYLYTLIVARLGPSEYGLLSLGFGVVNFVVVFAVLGLTTGTVRYVSYYIGKKDEFKIRSVINSSLKISLVLSLIVSTILFIFAENISIYFFHEITLAPILKAFAIAIPFLALGRIIFSAMKAFKRIGYQTSIEEVMYKALKVLITLLLLYLGYNLFGAVAAYVASTVIAAIIGFIVFQRRIFPIVKKKIKTISFRKELIKFSWPLALSETSSSIVGWLDVLMLGYFKTVTEVGIYNVALPTAALLLIIPKAVLSLFLPITTELYGKGDTSELKKIYLTVSKWVFFIVLPIFLLMIVFSKQILTIMFGSEYTTGYIALSILMIGYLFTVLHRSSSHTLKMIRKTKIILSGILIAAILNIIVNIILIPKYGMIGGAIATSASFLTTSIIILTYCYKHTKLQPFQKNYIKAILAGLISMVVIYLLTEKFFEYVPLHWLIIMLIAFMIFYFMLLLLFKGLDKDDIEIMKSIEKRVGLKLSFISRIIKKFQ